MLYPGSCNRPPCFIVAIKAPGETENKGEANFHYRKAPWYLIDSTLKLNHKLFISLHVTKHIRDRECTCFDICLFKNGSTEGDIANRMWAALQLSIYMVV